MGWKFRFIVVVMVLGLFLAQALRNSDEPLVVDYAERYIYRDIKEKFEESLSINNCSLVGPGVAISDPRLTSEQTPSREDANLVVDVIVPSRELRAEWGSVHREKNIEKTKVYMQVTKALCEAKHFQMFKRGEFKRGKGCYEMFIMVKGKRVKRINRWGATLHPSHTRCNTADSVAACLAASDNPHLLPWTNRKLNNYPFVVTVSEGAIVARSGFLSMSCGVFGLFGSCEAVKWGVPVANSLVGSVDSCRAKYRRERSVLPPPPQAAVVAVATTATGQDGSECPVEIVDSVFVMSQYDDTQIGQFVLESLPRLVFHLNYVLNHPHTKIHYGFTKKRTVPNFVLPHYFFQWLGLQDRLINGSYYADQVLVTREGGCQDVSYNAWELLNQRQLFIKLASQLSKQPNHQAIQNRFPVNQMESLTGKRFVILIERTPNSRFIQNKGDMKLRVWPNQSAPMLASKLAAAFPQYDFRSFSDRNSSLMACPPCQIRLFMRAAVVVAVHGAGMTNTMYMPTGGVVVEYLPYFDSRMAPATGIFPRLSAVVGLHHYSYYVAAGTSFDPNVFVNDVRTFHDRVTMWSHD